MPKSSQRKIDELLGLLEKIQAPDHDQRQDLDRVRHIYRDIPRDDRADFFTALIPRLEVHKSDVAEPLAALSKADETDDASEWGKRASTLRQALESPRMRALRKFLSLKGGLKFLLDMRADILTIQRRTGRLFEPLDDEIAHLFTSWFQQGFLFLDEITLDSSYRVIHFLGHSDMVHPMSSIEEMAERLGEDRRCFALYHRAMPEEPVVFIECALTRGAARSIATILETQREASGKRPSPDTAVFYSINNAQNGLSGLGLGKMLISQVVEALEASAPEIKNFVTLSPMPGFWKRYLRPLLEGRDQGFVLKRHRLAELIGDKTTDALRERCHEVHGTRPADTAAVLLQTLSDPNWVRDEGFTRLLRKPLLDLGFHYLTVEKDPRGRPLNPVANFHLGNGASISPGDLNFLGNPSPRGIDSSCGLMVNYIYSATFMHSFGRTVRSLLPWKPVT